MQRLMKSLGERGPPLYNRTAGLGSPSMRGRGRWDQPQLGKLLITALLPLQLLDLLLADWCSLTNESRDS